MQRAIVRQKRIYTHTLNIIASTIVKKLKQIINSNERKELFDGEHVLKLNINHYMMYFDSNFKKQRPHYHIGNAQDITDLHSNGGGERNLYGITDNGLGIKTPSQNIIIKPNSVFHIHFPGSPPTIHQFYGINSFGEGTAMISVHNTKTREYDKKNMATYTVFVDDDALKCKLKQRRV